MPLSEQRLSGVIENFIKSSQAQTQEDPEVAVKNFADSLAQAIVNEIKQSSVKVTIPPLTVSQGVSPSVVANPTPIVLDGNLS